MSAGVDFIPIIPGGTMAKYPPPNPPFIGAKHRGGSQTPTLIVIHSTVGPTKKGSARSIGNYFKRGTVVSSAHYGIDAAEVIQYVGDHTVAYHCGYNQNSVGLEMCDYPSSTSSARWKDADHKAMLSRTAKLTAELGAAYGIPMRFLSDAKLRKWGENKIAKNGGIVTHDQMSRVFKKSSHWDPGKWPAATFLLKAKAARAALAIKPTPKPESKPVTSHTRWAVRVTGVHATKGGKKLRDLQPGESFKVIDGSGHGNDGWIETTHHNWVVGTDTTTVDPAAPKVFSVMTWNVENKGEADAALDRAEIVKLLDEKKPRYACFQEVYRVDLRGIPGYQTYQAFDGYSADSENRAQAILVRNDVAVKIKQALVMHEKWIGPKMGKEKDPRIHRYTVGNEYDTNIPVATVHVPFTKAAIEETRKAIIDWMLAMKAAHGIAIVVGDWNGLADELQAKVGNPAGAKVDGGGLDKAVFLGVKKVKGENLNKRGRSDHPVKIWTFEAS
jgi:N-acetylmuramoyl-L-alanine amidase CwlA/endonuclease/exonuclease/phosphatase family metal-dependent hydrolase